MNNTLVKTENKELSLQEKIALKLSVNRLVFNLRYHNGGVCKSYNATMYLDQIEEQYVKCFLVEDLEGTVISTPVLVSRPQMNLMVDS